MKANFCLKFEAVPFYVDSLRQKAEDISLLGKSYEHWLFSHQILLSSVWLRRPAWKIKTRNERRKKASRELSDKH